MKDDKDKDTTFELMPTSLLLMLLLLAILLIGGIVSFLKYSGVQELHITRS